MTRSVPPVENPIVLVADLNRPVEVSPKFIDGVPAEPVIACKAPVKVSPAFFTRPKLASSKLPTS